MTKDLKFILLRINRYKKKVTIINLSKYRRLFSNVFDVKCPSSRIMDHETKEERCYINFFPGDFFFSFIHQRKCLISFIEYTIYHRLIQKRGYIEKKKIFSFFFFFFRSNVWSDITSSFRRNFFENLYGNCSFFCASMLLLTSANRI